MLLLCFSLFLLLNTAFARYFRQSTLLLLDNELYYSTSVTRVQITGVMNGPLKFLTARKILPLLDLLAKFKRVLACSCSPNFCVARKLAKQIFYFCSCSQKNCSARHACKCSQRPFVTPNNAKNEYKYWYLTVQSTLS